jgi:DNA-binding response OmpR family regulator
MSVSPGAASATAKILIVEDDPDISGLLGLRLRRAGYETSYAADAVTALTIARKERPDAIVLDFGLPGGDALVVMERLRAVAPLSHVPVIVVSARDPEATGPVVLAAGAQAFVAKPVAIDEFLTAVRAAVDPV